MTDPKEQFPEIVPAEVLTGKDAEIARLRKELERIAALPPGGPYIDARSAGAALVSLDRARDIARAALADARAEEEKP